MLISYNWLQNYFDEKLPEPQKLAELLTFSFAEVESIETIDHADLTQTKRGNDAEERKDTILDIKVLPDRACYALSHRGVAYEVAAITGLKQKEMRWPQPKAVEVRPLEVKVEEPELCVRYMARVVENVNQKALPWVKKHLEAIGQRSINPIVDGANIVMFDMGQPLHVFDADKVEGKISVRFARAGEKIITLDDKEIELDKNVLVIADERAPLAIAGIKGGRKAEVTEKTKNLILESANFDAVSIRKTSGRIGIKTDASKRFENRISPEMAEVGMMDFSAYLFEMDKNIRAGEVVDVYGKRQRPLEVAILPSEITDRLGTEISEEKITDILKRLSIRLEKREEELILTPPAFRLDLNIKEDFIEEVGRIYGYEKIETKLPKNDQGKISTPALFRLEWKIRELLSNNGFSEIMTSSFFEKGEMEIEKPLAEDKKYARENLRGGFSQALKTNTLNTPLLGFSQVRIFEIGRVFTHDRGERTHLAVGIQGGGKTKQREAEKSAHLLVSEFFKDDLKEEFSEGVMEVDISKMQMKSEVSDAWNISIQEVEGRKFKPFSPYPFISRDVALFVPKDAEVEDVAAALRTGADTNLLVKGPDLFDDFMKNGRRSLAFRMVFQSFERTLSDAEVNEIMEKVYLLLRKKGWEVR